MTEPSDGMVATATDIVQTFFVRDFELTTKPRATLKDKICLADRIAQALTDADARATEKEKLCNLI